MKIIAIIPVSTGIYKDDTTMLLDGLEKYHGCTVIRMRFELDGSLIFISDHGAEDMVDADLIWAPYEPLIEVAFAVRAKLGNKIPVVGHYEQVPPSRVKLEEVNDHFIKSAEPLPDTNSTQYYQLYKAYAKLWSTCEVRTTTEQYTFDRIERLLGMIIRPPVYTKPYPLDDELLEKYKDDTIEEKYQIVSCMRLVDHKRHHHVIKALSLLKNPPKYVIVGEGSERAKLEKLAKDLNVDVEFKGVVSDEEKSKIIQEAMFGVYPWAWLPVSEMAYYKKPSIAYYQPDTRNRLWAMPIYVTLNNIEELSKMIEILSDDKAMREQYGNNAYEMLMTGKTHTHPLKVASEKLLDIFKKVKE